MVLLLSLVKTVLVARAFQVVNILLLLLVVQETLQLISPRLLGPLVFMVQILVTLAVN